MINQFILNLNGKVLLLFMWTTFGSTNWTFIALQYFIRDNYLRLNDHHCFAASLSYERRSFIKNHTTLKQHAKCTSNLNHDLFSQEKCKNFHEKDFVCSTVVYGIIPRFLTYNIYL